MAVGGWEEWRDGGIEGWREGGREGGRICRAPYLK